MWLYKEVGEVKRVLAWEIIFAYLAFLGVLIFVMVNCSTEIKELKFEAIEQQKEVHKSIDIYGIVEKIVIEAESGRIEKNDDSGFTYDEAQMLMKIAMAEAEEDGIEGQAMVMAVVLNRVNDQRFPDSIEKVIFQKNQFSPIVDGRYYKAEPDVNSHLALAEIEKGNFDDVDALYFENASESWQASNCKYIGTVGHHRFYK
jgi:N-acetylmuramoyl-L-alanine amidase